MDYIAPYPSRIFLALDLLVDVAPHMPGVVNPMTIHRKSSDILKIAIGALIVMGAYFRSSMLFKKVVKIEPSDPFFFRFLAWTSSALYGSKLPFWGKSLVLTVESGVHLYRLKNDTDESGQHYETNKLVACVAFSSLCGIAGAVAYRKWIDTPIFSETVGKALSYIRSKKLF